MKFKLRHLALGVLLSSAFAVAVAVDLPVKRVNGHDYYYYEVKRGETLLQIAEKLGITRDNILRYNPSASDGLRAGTNLYLPVDKFSASADDNSAQPDAGMLRYKVQKGETLYGIAYRFNVTPASLVALNPKADYGVKAGDILLVPGENVSPEMLAEIRESMASDKASQAAPATASEAPVEKGETTMAEPSAIPVEPTVAPANADIPAADDALYNRRLKPVEAPTAMIPAPADTPNVALLAPLDIHGDTQGKHARNALDFVRGFLMGIDNMRDGALPVNVRIVDTRGSNATASAVLSASDLADLDLVIAPDEPSGLVTVLSDVKGRDCYVLNLFAAQDTSYLVNPQSVQTYIPSHLMYEKAGEALLDNYGDYTPVFLIARGGKSEKLPFTNYLRELFANGDIAYEEISFDGVLSSDQLSALSREGRYVFIPASGAHSEFTKFSRALLNFKGEFVNPDDVAVFGYPDWTAFIDESMENLHNLGAMVYTRFYKNADSVASQEFSDEFERLYATKPLERLPSQAMLGYDAAGYILTNLANNSNVFNPEDGRPYSGIQSTFMFLPSDSEDMTDEVRTTGPVNQALYIVKYLPDNHVSVEVM